MRSKEDEYNNRGEEDKKETYQQPFTSFSSPEQHFSYSLDPNALVIDMFSTRNNSSSNSNAYFYNINNNARYDLKRKQQEQEHSFKVKFIPFLHKDLGYGDDAKHTWMAHDSAIYPNDLIAMYVTTRCCIFCCFC